MLGFALLGGGVAGAGFGAAELFAVASGVLATVESPEPQPASVSTTTAAAGTASR
jgi:hypothetical protein